MTDPPHYESPQTAAKEGEWDSSKVALLPTPIVIPARVAAAREESRIFCVRLLRCAHGEFGAIIETLAKVVRASAINEVEQPPDAIRIRDSSRGSHARE